MIRDPFYRKIIQRLNGPLDEELFEQCAADLLRSAFPTLVPIRGGSDFGMDGAIADGEGEPFPLITTTSKNVIGNLTRNLKSYVDGGGARRKVVVATSQELSSRRRKNLQKRAADFGFVLVQIHDQADFADRLYRNPKWCKELLNLIGDPAPLSVVPKSERPFISLSLIGREADLDWLRKTKGDKLLVGQPGSGKTFLLRKLVSENGALFVNTDERDKIAEGIREQRPRVLIVDDAQIRQNVLLELKQLRDELDASFDILASGWLGDEPVLVETLNLPSSQVHRLELLPIREIVKIINAMGIQGPNRLITELVFQAEGRPGLAVTLADLCLKGDVKQVALGDALSRSVLRYFNRTIGTRATSILAAFSIGGDAGMDTIVVANALGLGLLDLADAVVTLATGGIILPLSHERLAVHPRALREALVRDVFFRGVAPIPSEPLLMRAPSAEQAALTLVGAQWRDAAIPHDTITRILEQADSNRAWREYASLGREETRWVLKNHQEKLILIADPALHYLPEISIPLLLEAAIGDERQLNSATDHPMRLISEWIQSAEPSTSEPIRRRTALVDAASKWLIHGKDSNIGLAALVAAFYPRFEIRETDPTGRSVNIRYGILSTQDLQTIQGFWAGTFDVLQKIEIDNWEPVQHMVETWAFPRALGVIPPESTSNLMDAFARKMLLDIISISMQRTELAYWAKRTAEQLHVDIQIHLDRDLEILYPYEKGQNWREIEEQQTANVLELAREWNRLNPEEVVRRINSVESTARHAKLHWPRWTPFICEQIAAQAASPNSWVRLMAHTVKTGDLILPFLRKAASQDEPGWAEVANDCLDRPEFKWSAITTILALVAPPKDLLDKVLANLEGYSQWVETLCIRNQVPETTLQKLLSHQDAELASAAAAGEWHSHRTTAVRESLCEDWRNAVLRTSGENHWLREVLVQDHTLAYDWLQRHLAEYPSAIFSDDATFATAVRVLDLDARRHLLQQVPATHEMAQMIAMIVDNNLDLYRDLLGDSRLKQLHLVPLGGYPEGVWIEKAKLALDAGYSIEAVANSIYEHPGFLFWGGDESNMWAQWVQRFDQLCSDEDERIRKVGDVGKVEAEANLKRALDRERRDAIFGDP